MAAGWRNAERLQAIDYRCGHCGKEVGTDLGYYSTDHIRDRGARGIIYLCPRCDQPTYICGPTKMPAVAPGNDVENVPPEVSDLYAEARRCVSVAAYTASVLACRKLLMNIAVAEGAKEGELFGAYVQYLSDSGYVPPNGKAWVDHIRKRGNEATHEIKPKTEEDAIELISFAEMLLKFIYEFPSRVPSAKSDGHP